MSAHVLKFRAAQAMERAAGQGVAELGRAHDERNMSAPSANVSWMNSWQSGREGGSPGRRVRWVNQIEKDLRRAEMAGLNGTDV